MYESTTELQGEVLRPETVQKNRRLPAGGVIRRNSPFVAAFHHNWEYIEDEQFPDGKWLPRIAEAFKTPNGNGVSMQGTEVRFGPMLQGLRDKRSIIIDQFDPRLGELGAYLRRTATNDGGYMYTYVWVTFALINNGRNAVVVKDTKMERAFRQRIVDQGMVPAMPRHAVDTDVARMRETIRRLRVEADRARINNDSFAAREAEINERIRKMYAAWEREFAGAEVVVAPMTETEFDIGDTLEAGDGPGVPGVSLPSEPRGKRR